MKVKEPPAAESRPGMRDVIGKVQVDRRRSIIVRCWTRFAPQGEAHAPANKAVSADVNGYVREACVAKAKSHSYIRADAVLDFAATSWCNRPSEFTWGIATQHRVK